jgi:DNA-binding SARP family transcriptional activator
VEVRVLGPFEARRNGDLLRFGGRKEQAVVAILALQPGRAVTADRLIDTLWGDEAPKTAAKTLQTYVSRVRRVVGQDTLRTIGAGYALQVRSDDVDALVFEQQVERGRSAAAAGEHARAATELGQALARWRGEPLAEFGFATGQAAELVPVIAALLAENPLREALWASLMLALYRAGRQADALRAFQQARRALVDQLGIEPGPELKDLEARILAQDPTLAQDLPLADGSLRADADRSSELVPLPVSIVASGHAEFVGRSLERERLHAAWDRVVAGSSSVVLVAGEPGVGKSRLAADLALRVRGDGGMVLFGRCDEEQLVPYQPFVEALRHFVRHSPAARQERLAEVASEAARLVPALRVTSEPSTWAGDDGDRLSLFDGVAEMLGVAAAGHPLLLVIDDLHWADRATLLLLRHLISSDQTPPLLILATYRDTELRRDHPLADALALLRGDPRVHRLLLGGLTIDDVRQLVSSSALIDESQIADLSQSIHQETGGNAFFVQEVVRHLLETGGAPDGRLQVPEGVRDVVGRRLARLSDDVNRVLTMASVIGQTFDVPIVVSAAAWTEEGVLAALDEARRAGLVREVIGTPDRFEFAHAIVRSTLYDEIGASRRVRAHRAVAAAFEELRDTGSPEVLAAVAHHLIEAAQVTDARRAADYARLAGENAVSQLAFEDAIRHFQRAREAIELMAEPDEDLRRQILLNLGRTLVRLDIDAGSSVLWDVVKEVESEGLLEPAAIAAIALCGMRPLLGGESDPVVQLLRRLVAAGPTEDSVIRLRLLANLSVGLSYVAPKPELLSLSGQSLAIGRRLGERRPLGEAMVARLFALNLPNEADERLALAGELLRIGRESGDNDLVLHALRHRYSALLERGAASAAWAESERYLDLAKRRRDVLHEDTAHSFLLTQLISEARFSEAEELLVSLAANTYMEGIAPLSMILGTQRLLLSWLWGRPLDHLVPAVGDEPLRGVLDPIVAMADAVAGRVDSARQRLSALLGPHAEIPQNWLWAGTVFNLAVATSGSAHGPSADRLTQELEPHAGRMLTVNGRMFLGAVDHHLGQLAVAAGRPADGVDLLRRATDSHRTMGFHAWVVRSQLGLAQALAATGFAGEAAEVRASATTLASHLGIARI